MANDLVLSILKPKVAAVRLTKRRRRIPHKRSAIVRLSCMLAALAVLGGGCGDSRELTAAEADTLSARTLAEVCVAKCADLTIYVRDQVFTFDALVGKQVDMSAEMMSAINNQLGGVEFVNKEQASALVIDGVLIDDGAILMFVGPVTQLGPNVVGVEVGSHTAHDGASGGTQQFRWTGQAWEPADPEDTGITIATWVS